MQYVQIPKDRLAVLIGKSGETIRKIQKITNTKIIIDGNTAFVEGDPSNEWIAKDIVYAITHGFNPENAFSLVKEDNVLDTIVLNEKRPSRVAMIKGRIIGHEGKTRRLIEMLTGCYISVYNKEVGIIGNFSQVQFAHDAIDMIISGSKHGNVYAFLENKKHRKKQYGEDFDQ